MVNVLASSMDLIPSQVKPKTMKLLFVASLRSKDLLAWNQNNISELSDVSICKLLFQRASTIRNPIKCVGLVQRDDIII